MLESVANSEFISNGLLLFKIVGGVIGYLIVLVIGFFTLFIVGKIVEGFNEAKEEKPGSLSVESVNDTK